MLMSHENCDRVLDQYSVRGAPQVHGAVRDALDFVTRTLSIEINAATDNPMVFAESGELLLNRLAKSRNGIGDWSTSDCSLETSSISIHPFVSLF